MSFSPFYSRRAFLGRISGLSALAALFPFKLFGISEFVKNKFGERMIERYPSFNDARSKKVIFVAHCIINMNARCNGSGVAPSAMEKIPEFLLKHHIGIAQMPCPELGCLGLGREGNIYDQLSTPGNRKYLKSLAQDVIYQVKQYRKQNFKVLGVLGINCSPSCGVDCHADNGSKPGKGAFMEELTEALEAAGLEMPVIGVMNAEADKAVAQLEKLDPS